MRAVQPDSRSINSERTRIVTKYQKSQYKAILLLANFSTVKVYALQFLHTASLVGQNKQEIVAMGVQGTYILFQD